MLYANILSGIHGFNNLKILFTKNEPIVIVNYYETNELVRYFNESIVMLEKPYSTITTTPDFIGKNFVIFANNDGDLNKTIKEIQLSTVWSKCHSSSGNFLVVCKACTLNIFKQLWDKDIFGVVLNNFTHFISSSPYMKENECGQNLEWFLVEPFNALNQTQFFKVPKTLQYCNMTAFPLNQIYNFPILYIVNNQTTGLLVNVLEMIALTLNINLMVMEDNEKLRYHEKYFANRDFFYHLTNNKTIDTVLGSSVLHINIFDVCRCTKIFFEGSHYWVVSKPLRISNLKLIFIVFNAGTWLLFLAVHVTSNFTYHFLSTYNVVESNAPTFSKTVFNFIKILLENSVTLPRMGKLQVFLVFFLWYNLLISTYYKSQLASVLTEPVYEKKFSSFADMLEHNVKFLAVSNIQDIIINENTLSKDYIENNFIERHYQVKEPECVEDIIKYRNFTTHVNELYLKVYPNWKEQVKIIGSQHLNAGQFLFNFRHSYPFRNRINEVIEMMTSHGIIIKMINSFEKHVWIFNEEINTRLTIDHLICAFIIIFVGAVCGFCVFLLELVYSCFRM